ncbi:MAG: hypothetical protein HUU57_09005 [Bdellovibrio sp.]|nr:hypothetical protein [Bdellovibrio sp.]
MRSILALGILVLTLNACTSTPTKNSIADSVNTPTAAEDTSGAIDYFALQSHLRMGRERESLGFSEKSFNTCEAGYGYSRSQNCHHHHFVVIHFRLLCRDSEGTISNILTDEDLRPLDRRSVKWSLKGTTGVAQTDGQGYGQIVTAVAASQRSQRIRLALGNEFLYMRANEIQKVITPAPWCDQY